MALQFFTNIYTNKFDLVDLSFELEKFIEQKQLYILCYEDWLFSVEDAWSFFYLLDKGHISGRFFPESNCVLIDFFIDTEDYEYITDFENILTKHYKDCEKTVNIFERKTKLKKEE